MGSGMMIETARAPRDLSDRQSENPFLRSVSIEI
jgi:hypothetical protein